MSDAGTLLPCLMPRARPRMTEMMTNKKNRQSSDVLANGAKAFCPPTSQLLLLPSGACIPAMRVGQREGNGYAGHIHF